MRTRKNAFSYPRTIELKKMRYGGGWSVSAFNGYTVTQEGVCNYVTPVFQGLWRVSK